ncbi:hypothetical protein BgAZ_205290 [Babesia gibsoni]|uniref:Uncharacterized protein n=1 Tax=Babesia gibsoni TaxID=33632 RepID=A0AAD8LLB1_BABGI|nr:hypothetical protein BgAZ_205290 [Babesia gibsoni]
MDFYISSLAARIPCTRLHRQIQDPRGRAVVSFAISSDGRLAAMATYPREHRSVESSVNVLFKDGKAVRGSNYHKAVQRQRRLTEKSNELEFNVEQYINHTLQMDSLGNVVREIGLSTPSLRHIIKDNHPEPAPLMHPIVPCAVIIYDTMYFNPIEEFIYGYKMNQSTQLNMQKNAVDSSYPTSNQAPQMGNTINVSSKCFFKPNLLEFACDDTLLVLTSGASGAKVYSMDTEYVELLGHYKPQLRDDVILESFKVLKCELVLEHLAEVDVANLPDAFTSCKATCQACKEIVMADADTYGNDALPYTVVFQCIISVSLHPPLFVVYHSKWPSGDVSMVAVRPLFSITYPPASSNDHLTTMFKARLTMTKEFMTLNRAQTYWFLEPYVHDHVEYLIQSDKPVKCGYTKTLLATEVKSKDYLEFHALVAVYAPDHKLYILDPTGKVLGNIGVPESEEGYFNIDVTRDGNMIAMIGSESIVIYNLFLSRAETGEMAAHLEQHTRFPHVIGVGRREEIITACFGGGLGNRWMYVSVARGSVDAVLYIVDIAQSKGKDPIKRTLNMNSVLFPCVTSMIAMDSCVIVMPRHQRYLIQLTQEHMDNSDDTYSRQFCHFPILATNKEALTLNGTIMQSIEPAPEKFDLLLLERERQIGSAKKLNYRLNVARWLDALYQYNALCMYKGRSMALGMDPHDFLLPPLRRARQQYPFAYDAKQFYDPLIGVEFIGSPALMRAQCYEWVREAIARSGFVNPMYPLDVIYDYKLQMLDYVYAKICISQYDNPSELIFPMRTNDFLRLQLVNFLKISQRLDIQCDGQGLIPYDKTMIYKKIREVIPLVIKEGVGRPLHQSRASVEREAFTIMREQLLPELMDIPTQKVKKIIRDRLYRLRKKLAQLERFKVNHDVSDEKQMDFTLDEIARSDCRLPAFREDVPQRELSMSEFAMRLRMKVLSSFYKSQKENGPDYDELYSS